VDTQANLLGSLIGRLRARGLTISRLQQLHPTIDRTVLAARRAMYTRRFFREGPRKRGVPGGRTFVVFNHCYDLDVDALCSAEGPHAVWVLDPFAMFTDVFHYFPPEQRDIACVYGAGEMRESIARFKAAYVTDLARRLVREIRLDALIAPSDTFYYLRPLIEELRALGVPTIIQDKEGTIAPSPIMVEHAKLLATRYPPIADQYYFWNETCAEFWRGIGLPDAKIRVLGQPRSDFFFHADRWPSKAELGLTEGKRLVVVFTYDADAYLRVTDPIPNGPWKPMRDDLHEAVRALARERDDIEVVVKAHPQQTELADVLAEFAAHPVPNVKVMAGAKSASHLLVRADVIVGFQSTVMIEAMLTTKPVIYAGWGEEHERRSATLVPIHLSGGCTLVDGRAALERRLRDALDGRLAPAPEMMRARKAFTDRYFWDADGRASARILDAAAAFVSAA
jgi:CDP-glycerol:poly(glycerophosphate) glycerophosphotransferase